MTTINGDDRASGRTTGGGELFGSVLGALANALVLGLAEAGNHKAADAAGLAIDADTFGRCIRLARAERGMSLRELARLTGVSEMRLEKYEQDDGFWKPSFDEVVSIRKALGISADSIKRFL